MSVVQLWKVLTILPRRSEGYVLIAALVASLLSLCLLFQAVDDFADGQLSNDLRGFGLLLIAGAAFAIALLCAHRLKRGRSLRAVRWSIRANLFAAPALRSPFTFFLLTFAAILALALTAHLGELGVATLPERGDVVVSLVTAIALALAATVGAQIIIRVAPEVVRFFIATLLARLAGCSRLVIAFGTKTTALHSWAAWSPPLFGRPPPLPHSP